MNKTYDYEFDKAMRKIKIKQTLEHKMNDIDEIVDIIYERERELNFLNMIRTDREKQLEELIKLIENKDNQKNIINKKIKIIEESLEE